MHVNCLSKDLSVKKIIHPLLGCKHLLPLMITGGSTMLNYMIGLCKFLDNPNFNLLLGLPAEFLGRVYTEREKLALVTLG
jgi:hypothetical protein